MPFFVKLTPAVDTCAAPKKLLLLLFPHVFGVCTEPIAKLRSGAVSNRASVGEKELLSPAALDVIPDVTVEDPLWRELCKFVVLSDIKENKLVNAYFCQNSM